jgi:hypothetical protein
MNAVPQLECLVMRCACFVIICFILVGCHTYRPVEVTVLDGMNDQPMPGIPVEPNIIPKLLDFFAPNSAPVYTDSRGVAIVMVCTNYALPQHGIYIGAERYLLDQTNPERIVWIPWDEFLAADSDQPFQVTARLLTFEERRSKY